MSFYIWVEWKISLKKLSQITFPPRSWQVSQSYPHEYRKPRVGKLAGNVGKRWKKFYPIFSWILRSLAPKVVHNRTTVMGESIEYGDVVQEVRGAMVRWHVFPFYLGVLCFVLHFHSCFAILWLCWLMTMHQTISHVLIHKWVDHQLLPTFCLDTTSSNRQFHHKQHWSPHSNDSQSES